MDVTRPRATKLSQITIDGDLVLGTHRLKFTDLLLKQLTADAIGARNIGDTVDKNLQGLYVIGSNRVQADLISELTADAGVTVDGVKLKDSIPYCDSIAEKTAAAGVSVDGVKLKDSIPRCDIISENTAGVGVTVDGRWIKDGRASTQLTVAQFQAIVATGDATNPTLLNNGMTVETGASFTLNQYVELEFDEFKAITQFRIYPYNIQHNGVGRFAIQYWNGAAWVNWKTGIPTSSTDAWVNWETVSTIVTKKLRIVCTTVDTGDTFSRCIELEVKY